MTRLSHRIIRASVASASLLLAGVASPVSSAPAPARARVSDAALARAKDLYLSAAYEDALVLLDSVKSDVSSSEAVEAAEYRVFCLLALNRRAEADAAIQRMVAADPLYQPSEAQASPRIRAVFREVRRSVLPGIVQRAYSDAKSAFDRKDPQAAGRFDQLLVLLADPDLAGQPMLADMRTLATGFRDLSHAIVVPAPVTSAAPAQAPAPAPVAADAAAPAAGSANDRLVPPETISQPMPPWQPVSSSDRGTFKGALQVQIDEHGAVVSATILSRIHPAYDDQLIKMARTWKFKPATRNGVPTPYTKTLTVTLRP